MKNIVFDIGNVLLLFKPKDFLKELGFNQEVQEEIYNLVFSGKEWLDLDRGVLDEAKATEIFIEKSPKLEEEIKLVMGNWQDVLVPIEESVNILRELDKKGYNIYFLSNFHKEAFETVYNKYDFLRIGKGRVVSYECGLLKPEKEIYERLLSLYNLNPQETLFIDDTLVNIEAAEELWIKGYHFSESGLLKNFLEKILK